MRRRAGLLLLLVAVVAAQARVFADELLFGPPTGGGVATIPFDATQAPGCVAWDGITMLTHPSNLTCTGGGGGGGTECSTSPCNLNTTTTLNSQPICLANGTNCPPAGASTFDAIGSGTNTTAAMVVGSGASLAASGTGTIAATEVVCTGCVTLGAGATVNSEIKGTLPIANGGTNQTTLTANRCLRFDGSAIVPASGDCPAGDTTGSSLTEGTAIDISGTVIGVDTTELTDITWSDGATPGGNITWQWDNTGTGGSDTKINFDGNGGIEFTTRDGLGGGEYVLMGDTRIHQFLDVGGNLAVGSVYGAPTGITLEGATADAFETNLVVVDPTADRTITFPDLSGTVILSTDTGTVSNTMLAGTIPIATGGTNATSFTTNTCVRFDGTRLVSAAADCSAVTVTAGTAIDVTAGVIDFDPTELTNVTVSDGLSATASTTYNLSGGDDPVLTAKNAGFVIASSGIPVFQMDDTDIAAGTSNDWANFINCGAGPACTYTMAHSITGGVSSNILAAGSTGSVTLGDTTATAITLTTDGTGDGELTVPAGSIALGTETTGSYAAGDAPAGGATTVTGSATLPATCTEKDVYQDTDSGGTEFYVCTATNTWTKVVGTTDVPAYETDPTVPLLTLADLGDLCAANESTKRNSTDTANICVAVPVPVPTPTAPYPVGVQESAVTVGNCNILNLDGVSFDASGPTAGVCTITLATGVMFTTSTVQPSQLSRLAANDQTRYFGTSDQAGLKYDSTLDALTVVGRPLVLGPTVTPVVTATAATPTPTSTVTATPTVTSTAASATPTGATATPTPVVTATPPFTVNGVAPNGCYRRGFYVQNNASITCAGGSNAGATCTVASQCPSGTCTGAGAMYCGNAGCSTNRNTRIAVWTRTAVKNVMCESLIDTPWGSSFDFRFEKGDDRSCVANVDAGGLACTWRLQGGTNSCQLTGTNNPKEISCRPGYPGVTYVTEPFTLEAYEVYHLVWTRAGAWTFAFADCQWLECPLGAE